MDIKKLKRWRLILGNESEECLQNYDKGGFCLDNDQIIMDEALAAIYDDTSSSDDNSSGGSKRSAGLGKSAPRLAKWLGDIRKYFPEDIVTVIQNDAIERKNLTQLLFEPEVLKDVTPDIGMVSTLLALKDQIPEKTKETARELVRKLVADIQERLKNDIERAVAGAINKKEHSPIPSFKAIDWKYTISKNLKNYNVEHKKIIPEKFYYFNRARESNNWTIILDIDQSGSMVESAIYASIVGSIFASIKALKTHVVAFDTSVVDLSKECKNDPVDMIFGIQLGGGTNINKSVAYCQDLITEPEQSIFILISDLYEGGNQAQLIKRMKDMKESGVKVICLLAISDDGIPAYDERLAKKFAALDIPTFGATPNLLPELIEKVLKGKDLTSKNGLE
ncbi:VWA domain-containing protein [Tepidibacter hydrothermalis]|uniref:VWA domain-containing protein n=1 Tax=Tepidibacter hydrothermalis TaxID=3036126 RepID=A0ABY8E9Z3_9FIRM|nr:VWA domain-containing protein [Tepidibacter hydrothermalis]WFD09723.1 VWA domain-containing protein [Tepidibacter hydrothermalis]